MKSVPLREGFDVATWYLSAFDCLPSLGFFRVFRALRPLRSLNAVPQMKAGGDMENYLAWHVRVGRYGNRGA